MQKNHQDFFNFKTASQQDDGFGIARIFFATIQTNFAKLSLILRNFETRMRGGNKRENGVAGVE